MSEVRFRGIPVVPMDKDAKPEWHGWVKDGFVYGYLIDNDVIVGSVIELEEDYFNTEFWCRVKPETVGQYTGLNDKNNQKIYTGDIVKTFMGNEGIIKCGEYVDSDYIIEDGFGGEERKNVGYFVEYIIGGACYGLDNRTDKWIEIVGNIYENLKLLEVK